MIEFTEGIYRFYVYILTNKNRTVLYTGVTNNLHQRLYQHKIKLNPKSFTSKYNCEFLIYYEKYGWIHHALEREKEIKNLSRQKKFELIYGSNPKLEFLNHLFEIPTEIEDSTESMTKFTHKPDLLLIADH